MPATLHCRDFPISQEDVEKLWYAARTVRHHADDVVAIECVNPRTIQGLNKQYAGNNKPTNVLTFSYDASHDIALCTDIAQKEARGRGISYRDYAALLLAHAFLHAVGFDHEASEAERRQMQQAEERILKETGFNSDHL